MGRGFGNPSSDVDSWGKCLQWSLIIANILIMFGSIAVLAVGIWTVSDKSFMEVLLRNTLFMSTAYIMIVTGCLAFILSFLGCYGALKESKCMILTYFVLLFLLFVILLVGGILGYVFRQQVASGLRPEMIATIREYDPDKPNMPITLAWDETQTHLNCCGIALDSVSSPYTAWQTNTKVNSGAADKKVPASCCIHDPNGKATNCGTMNPVDPSVIYNNDCYTAGLAFVKDHAIILAALAIGISAVMVSGMIFSITFFSLID